MSTNPKKRKKNAGQEAKRKATQELAQLVGPRVRERREVTGKTQDQLAECLGVSRDGVSKIERGKSLPTSENLYKISVFFGVPMEYFLTGEYPPYVHPGLIAAVEEAREIYGRLEYLEHEILRVIGDQCDGETSSNTRGNAHGKNLLESRLLSDGNSTAPGFSSERNPKKNPRANES